MARFPGVTRAFLVAALLGGCCASPRGRFPMATGPDRTCDTGGPGGDDVYVWDCVAGEHILIHRFRGEWGCSDPIREVSACGTPTAYERDHDRQLSRCSGPAKEW